jgi:hypothetical protein
MYFSEGLILNSGPILRLELSAPFDEKGLPKPLVLVGTNGSGKTGALSTIADALAEMAAQHFVDVLPQRGAGHSFFRVLGGRTLRLDQPFELSALKFTHDGVNFFVRAKAGKLSATTIRSEYSRFDPIGSLPEEGNAKVVDGDQSAIERIFKSGA